MRKLEARAHRVMPWKNGGGTTTEIARFPVDATIDDFAWRISLAHVETAGPFSRFPGVERTIALVAGDGMTLAFEGRGEVELAPGGAPFAFPGDVPVGSRLARGAVEDFNAMSRRGAWRHFVARVPIGGPTRIATAGDACVVFLVRGGALVAGDHLEARDALLLDRGESLDLASPIPGELLIVDLWRA